MIYVGMGFGLVVLYGLFARVVLMVGCGGWRNWFGR